MKIIFGYIAGFLGFSCSGNSSKEYITGWLLGSGITKKEWFFKTPSILNHKLFIFISTKSYGWFEINTTKSSQGIFYALNLGFFIICLLKNKKNVIN